MLLIVSYFVGNMVNECVSCRRPRSSFDDNTTCAQCRVAAGFCQLDSSHPCSVCEAWPKRSLRKLRKSLCDLKIRAIQRGRQHWMSAIPHIEAWIANRPASTAATSKPGSEITSIVDSGDDFSSNVVITSTTEVIGDFEVHEPIGATTVMADGRVRKCGHADP